MLAFREGYVTNREESRQQICCGERSLADNYPLPTLSRERVYIQATFCLPEITPINSCTCFCFRTESLQTRRSDCISSLS